MAKKPSSKAAKKKAASKAAKQRPKAAARKSAPRKATAGKPTARKKPKAARAARRKKTAPARPAARRESVKSKLVKARPARRGAARGNTVAVAPAMTAAQASFAPVKPARGMPPAKCEPFRKLLLEKRAQLARDVDTLQREALSRNRQDASGDLSNMPIHMADLGTDNYEQEFTLSLIEGERAVLREIDEALQRIEQGTYGVCVATGKPIGRARLKAQPWAKYCYEYMLAQEKGQKGRV